MNFLFFLKILIDSYYRIYKIFFYNLLKIIVLLSFCCLKSHIIERSRRISDIKIFFWRHIVMIHIIFFAPLLCSAQGYLPLSLKIPFISNNTKRKSLYIFYHGTITFNKFLSPFFYIFKALVYFFYIYTFTLVTS